MWTSLQFICLTPPELEYNLIIVSFLERLLPFRINSKFLQMAFQNWLLLFQPPPPSLPPANPMLQSPSMGLPLLFALHRPLHFPFCLLESLPSDNPDKQWTSMCNSMPDSSVRQGQTFPGPSVPLHIVSPSSSWHSTFYKASFFLYYSNYPLQTDFFHWIVLGTQGC